MEIDVFYQNDDLSFGFDGMSKLDKNAYAFSKKAQYGFKDVDYSYADGTPDSSWGSRQKEAYQGRFAGWKPSYKKDCVQIKKFIDACKKQIARDEEDYATASSGRKNVLNDYIQGSKFALSELESYYDNAECELKKQAKEDADFTAKLSSFGTSTTAKVVLIGSVVLLVSVVGFLVYRRMN